MKEVVMRNKFVKYLTEGIDIHIPEDEVQIFYEMITQFINESNNDFEGIFLKDEENVLIADKYFDYIKFKYSENKIMFEHAHPSDSHYVDPEFVLNMGLAFVGVMVFIEKFAPSGDVAYIFPQHYDYWRI